MWRFPPRFPKPLPNCGRSPLWVPVQMPLAPSELALTPELLANYAQRQQALRAVDVTLAGSAARNSRRTC
jgi:hypothetical protein